MSISHPLKQGVIAVSAALTLLAVAPPASAAFASPGAVIGSFDPPFGLDIPNLGFKGTFRLNVSSGCNPGGAGGYVSTGANCAITVDTLTLNFYNSTVDPTGAPDANGQYLSTYTLGSPNSDYPNVFTNVFAPSYVTGAYYNAADQFAGFDTVDSDSFGVSVTDNSTGSGPGSAPISYHGAMALYFVSPFMLAGGADPAYLIDCPGGSDSEEICTRRNGVNSNGAIVTLNGVPESLAVAVPEPDTIPLALIGVGAFVVAGWRKRRKSAGQLSRGS